MSNISLHRSVLLQLLQQLYRDAALASALGFKGGTCLHFFHDLSRFSTDLDFSLLPDATDFDPVRLRKILERSITIRDEKEKKNAWFWLGTYANAPWNIKVEVSKRLFPETFEVLDLYGLSVRTMCTSSILAHKLCAITDRTALANRDLFDIHHLLSRHAAIEERIIEERTGKKLPVYIEELLTVIPRNISQRGILDGLGELLNSEQKLRVKKSLVEETLFLLRAYQTGKNSS